MNIEFPSYEEMSRIEARARVLRAEAARDSFKALGRMISGAFDRLAHGFHKTA